MLFVPSTCDSHRVFTNMENTFITRRIPRKILMSIWS